MTATPTQPVPDIERLDRILAIVAKKDKGKLGGGWDQNTWARFRGAEPPSPVIDVEESCGTAMCFAGWTVVDAGARLQWDLRRTFDGGWAATADLCRRPRGRKELVISDLAKELLGLTDSEAEALFEAENDLKQIRAVIRAIKRRAKQLQAASR